MSCCGSFVVYDFAGFLKILALISSPEATSTEVPSVNPVALDAAYWHAFQTCSAWDLFVLDLRIVFRSGKVQLRHEGL